MLDLGLFSRIPNFQLPRNDVFLHGSCLKTCPQSKNAQKSQRQAPLKLNPKSQKEAPAILNQHLGGRLAFAGLSKPWSLRKVDNFIFACQRSLRKCLISWSILLPREEEEPVVELSLIAPRMSLPCEAAKTCSVSSTFVTAMM